MIRSKYCSLGALVSVLSFSATQANADSFIEALKSGKVNYDSNLRYVSVDESNGLKDASGLTLRTFLGYTTGSIGGFSAKLEFEDSRVVLGQDEFAPVSPGYSAEPDPETTEVDQAYVQYKNDSVSTKFGRQVITFDDHRHVGHVGWRQDRQTFDAASVNVKPSEQINIDAAYVYKRNRILAEAADIDSKDLLVNASLATTAGKLSGYFYDLEQDDASEKSYETIGVRFEGKTGVGSGKILYLGEYAKQTKDEAGSDSFDADFIHAELGYGLSSGVSFKLGYESLGSDDGNYGFSTPLSTLHKFNGWADRFLATPTAGLEDLHLNVTAKLGGGLLSARYHVFSADEGGEDFGKEYNLIYKKSYGKHYYSGIKLARYVAENNTGILGPNTDADKIWIWTGVKF